MGHHHDRLAGRIAGHKGVDAGFMIHHVKIGHTDAAGDGHFFHDIAKPTLVGVPGGGVNRTGADHFCNTLATARQVRPADQRANTDQGNDRYRCIQPMAAQ